jgi:hypothetical protein
LLDTELSTHETAGKLALWRGMDWLVSMRQFIFRLRNGNLAASHCAVLDEILTLICPHSGIGRETAAALARRGAHVVLACRNIAKVGPIACTAPLAFTALGVACVCLHLPS